LNKQQVKNGLDAYALPCTEELPNKSPILLWLKTARSLFSFGSDIENRVFIFSSVSLNFGKIKKNEIGGSTNLKFYENCKNEPCQHTRQTQQS
jgi:hypothetical protein